LVFNYTLNGSNLKVKPFPAVLKMESMQLLLLLIILCVFIAVIAWGRYAEHALKKKVAAALRRSRCPKCGRIMNGARVTPLKQARKRTAVAVPQHTWPTRYRSECPHCGKALVCEAERGRIRFY
jgi:hypothetical protein